jgi:hypothetical protein
VSYELGISIYNNRLVWINGPSFPAGQSVIQTYRKPDGLKSKIPAGKRVIGDEGYKGELQISTRNAQDTRAVKNLMNRAKARQETFSKRINKIFKILDERFRHSVTKHKAVFEAVCVLVQYEMENGHPLFTI